MYKKVRAPITGVSWFVIEDGKSTSGGVGIGIISATRRPETLQWAK